MHAGDRGDPQARDVLLLALGMAGLALCITLVFLGMRSVMDVGGACADGGPYVSAQPCPDGAPAAMVLGILGLFAFGGLATWYGAKVGGIWAAAPLLAWSGLFLALGWNFVEYGILASPDGQLEWGWAIPGVMFLLMGGAPLVLGLSVFGGAPARRTTAPGGGRRVGPRVATAPLGPASGGSGVDAFRLSMAGTAPRATGPEPPVTAPKNPSGPSFEEGTQALLDRLERLADLLDRGLLETAEYETAKEAVMRELEARS